MMLGATVIRHVNHFSLDEGEGCAIQCIRPSGLNEDLDISRPFIMALAVCPECPQVDETWFLIAHLNDDHKWNIERIADWTNAQEKAWLANQVPATEGERSAQPTSHPLAVVQE